MSSTGRYRTPLLILGVIALLPAFQTCVSVWLEWYTVVSYPLLKIVMIAFPIYLWIRSGMNRDQIKKEIGLNKSSLLPGIITGGVMAAAIIIAFKASGLIGLIDSRLLSDKLETLGLTEYYWYLAVVISLWNSLFEEYYWRGFLIGKLRLITDRSWLIVLSGGVFFGLHHIFALLFIGNPLLICAGVSATILAGMIWTTMRIRGISLVDCYVSHVMADLAVFYAGYLMLKASG